MKAIESKGRKTKNVGFRGLEKDRYGGVSCKCQSLDLGTARSSAGKALWLEGGGPRRLVLDSSSFPLVVGTHTLSPLPFPLPRPLHVGRGAKFLKC